MRLAIFFSILSCLLASSAVAQSQKWSGAHIGLVGGIAWSDSAAEFSVFNSGPLPQFSAASVNSINSSASPANLDASGGTFGVSASYNEQAGDVVYGVLVDFASLDLDGRHVQTINGPSTVTNSVSTDWLLTARGRLGLVANGVLFYGTAGLAVTDFEFSQTFVNGLNSATTAVSKTRIGWTVGAGLETHVAHGWLVGLDYLYADFGSVDSTSRFTNTAIGSFNTFASNDADLSTHVVRAQISRKF